MHVKKVAGFEVIPILRTQYSWLTVEQRRQTLGHRWPRVLHFASGHKVPREYQGVNFSWDYSAVMEGWWRRCEMRIHREGLGPVALQEGLNSGLVIAILPRHSFRLSLHPLCRAMANGGNGSLFKWAVTTVCNCGAGTRVTSGPPGGFYGETRGSNRYHNCRVRSHSEWKSHVHAQVFHPAKSRVWIIHPGCRT